MAGRSRGVTHLRRLLSEERPDAVFILANMGETLRSRVKKLVFFRWAGHRGPLFGVAGLPSRGLLRRRQFELRFYEHEVYGPVRAISECPRIGPVEDCELVQQLSIPEPAIRRLREIVPKTWITGRPLVAIAPGASFPHKMWPAERYVDVCRKLLREFDCRLVLVGSDGDRRLGAEIQASLGANCLDLTGRTSVTELAALLGQCRLLVGNDSGPAHLASASGCPCVTVTSALDFPGVWEPWNSRGRVARTRIDCEFCLSLTCCPLGTNACILAIEVIEVVGLCRQVLGTAVGDRWQTTPSTEALSRA
jgi:ADP-heptose:LPS heptosyltransferase